MPRPLWWIASPAPKAARRSRTSWTCAEVIELGKLASRIKDQAAELFIAAERRGVFRKLPAFEQNLSEYPELAILSENYATIRGECEDLIRQQLRIPGMEELTSYTSGGIHQIAWKSFMFKSGSFIEENCALAPKTAALLEKIPGLYTAF